MSFDISIAVVLQIVVVLMMLLFLVLGNRVLLAS